MSKVSTSGKGVSSSGRRNGATVGCEHKGAAGPSDPPGENGAKASEVFRRLRRTGTSPDAMTVEHLLGLLDDRSVAAVLLAACVPVLLPLPIGVANVLAVPLILVTGQITLGTDTVWLPLALRNRAIPARRLAGSVDRLLPLLLRLERFAHPRLGLLVMPRGLRIVGGSCLLFAVILAVPVPFIGWLPAFAILAVAVGLLEQDGVLVLCGLALGYTAVATLVGIGAAVADAFG